MCAKKMPWLEGWRGIAALMKASPTVIYDIGMGGMVTVPVGWADLRRYGHELADAVDLYGREGELWEEEGRSTTHLQESVLLGWD